MTSLKAAKPLKLNIKLSSDNPTSAPNQDAQCRLKYVCQCVQTLGCAAMHQASILLQVSCKDIALPSTILVAHIIVSSTHQIPLLIYPERCNCNVRAQT